MLVSLDSLKAFAGISGNAHDTVLQSILDSVEDFFCQQCSRAPFAIAASGRTEVHDGTGTHELWLEYPASSLTSVALGYDPLTPDETLDVSDPSVIVAAGARLSRVDGGTFGFAGAPLYVRVTYNASADLPQDAALAIVRAATAVFRQRGSEDASRESLGGVTTDFSRITESDPVWTSAVQAHRRLMV